MQSIDGGGPGRSGPATGVTIADSALIELWKLHGLNEMSPTEGHRAFFRIWSIDRVAIGMTLVLLLATAVFVFLEHSLPGPRWFQNKQTVFVAGSIGTEFIPLLVLEVLPDIDPERFPPPRLDETTQALAGGWIERYGFLERRNEDRTYPATNPELAALLKDDREFWSLPVGFTLSNYRPFSPDPSPVRFVGLACAGCHSARLPDRGPTGKLVYGAGNTGLDLIGFFQAFRGVLLAKQVKPSVPEERSPAGLRHGRSGPRSVRLRIRSLAHERPGGAEEARASRPDPTRADHDLGLAPGCPGGGREDQDEVRPTADVRAVAHSGI